MDRVDQLCDVCHSDFVRVAVESIQSQSRHQSVSDCAGIAEQVAGCEHRILCMPCTLFVHDQFDAMLRIGFSHHRPMLFDEVLHAVRAPEQFVPLVSRGLERVAIPRGAGVIMKRPAINGIQLIWSLLSGAGKKAASPADVSSVGSSWNELEFDSEARY